MQRFIEYQDSDEFALCENDSYYGTLICWPCSRGILGLEFRPAEKERGSGAPCVIRPTLSWRVGWRRFPATPPLKASLPCKILKCLQ